MDIRPPGVSIEQYLKSIKNIETENISSNFGNTKKKFNSYAIFWWISVISLKKSSKKCDWNWRKSLVGLHRCWWLNDGINFFGVGDRNLILVTSFWCRCPTLIFKDSGFWWRKQNRHQHLEVVANTFCLQHPSPTSMKLSWYHPKFQMMTTNLKKSEIIVRFNPVSKLNESLIPRSKDFAWKKDSGL